MPTTRAEYAAKKQSGLCIRKNCNNQRARTTLLCEAHRQADAIYHERYARTRRGKHVHSMANRRWRIRMARDGRCQKCGSDDLVTETLCAECRDERLADHRAKTQPCLTRTCGICRQPGHDRRTCDRRAITDYAMSIDELAGSRPGEWV